MIRPILPPQQMLELLMRMYEEHPVWLFSFGAVFGLFIAGLLFFIVREIRKSPKAVNEGGEN